MGDMTVRWSDIALRLGDEENSGLLCDIVVPEAVAGDWQRVLDLLHAKAADWEVTYFEDGQSNALPRRASQLVARSAEAAVSMNAKVQGLHIVGHVFAADWIEFDVPARDIDGQPSVDALVGFLEDLGRALGKQVRATPESAHDVPILAYEPGADEVRVA